MSGLPEQPRYDWTGVLEEECGVGIGGMETCDLPEGHAGFHSADGVPATREGKRGVRARLARFADRHGRLVPWAFGTDGLLWHQRRRMAREYERKMNRPISPGARAEMARRLAERAPQRWVRRVVIEIPEEAGHDVIEKIETAATHAAFDAEPKDRDGWDINVYSSREEAP